MTMIKFSNPVRNSINRYADTVFTRSFPFFFENDSPINAPAVNIKEHENHFLMEVVAPGLQKDNFKINITDKVLTVSYESVEHNETETGKVHRKEYRLESFKRSFALPQIVEKEHIQAKYEDGILKLELPKKAEARQNSDIQIPIL